MQRWIKAALLALAIGGTAGPAAAHYVDLKGALVRDGTLTFGVALTGRPFAYKQDGDLKGFELAIARAVADAHGLAFDPVRLPRGRLAQALAGGAVDAVNSLALVDPPAELVIVAYLVVGDHVMVLRGNPFRVTTVADLAGRTVSVTAGTTAESYARAVNRDLAETGALPMVVHSFPESRHTHFPVSMGHAAAFFLATVGAVAIDQDPESRNRLVPGAFRATREVGFAIRPGDTMIHHAALHAVAAMVATGKFRRLMERYGLPAELSPYR